MPEKEVRVNSPVLYTSWKQVSRVLSIVSPHVVRALKMEPKTKKHPAIEPVDSLRGKDTIISNSVWSKENGALNCLRNKRCEQAD